MLTPTATPFLTPTPSRPSPAATTVPASTAAGSPSASREAGDGQPGIPPSSLAAGEKSLAVIQNGDWKFIKNGGRVNLPNGLSAELSLDPYPPTQLTAMLDLYLTRRGQQVSNASVSAAYDMKGMAHGPFNSQAKNLGNGHYLFTMDYIEFGSWEHKLVIYLPEDHYELAVGVLVSP
jgi:hypothetical protein